MHNQNDNIADEDAFDTDEYLRKFDVIKQLNDKQKATLSKLHIRPEQDWKVSILVEYVTQQQQLNDNLDNLLIEMNNFMAQVVQK